MVRRRLECRRLVPLHRHPRPSNKPRTATHESWRRSGPYARRATLHLPRCGGYAFRFHGRRMAERGLVRWHPRRAARDRVKERRRPGFRRDGGAAVEARKSAGGYSARRNLERVHEDACTLVVLRIPAERLRL